MKIHSFPYIALALGLILLAAVLVGRLPDGNESTTLPLLTLLLMSEFGFFATAIGGYIGIRHIRAGGYSLIYAVVTAFCVVLSLTLLFHGISLWPR